MANWKLWRNRVEWQNSINPSFHHAPLSHIDSIDCDKSKTGCPILSTSVDYWLAMYALAEEMNHILSPLTGSSISYITIFKHLIGKTDNTTLKSCGHPVTSDVKILFVNVPRCETLSRVTALLQKDRIHPGRQNHQQASLTWENFPNLYHILWTL